MEHSTIIDIVSNWKVIFGLTGIILAINIYCIFDKFDYEQTKKIHLVKDVVNALLSKITFFAVITISIQIAINYPIIKGLLSDIKDERMNEKYTLELAALRKKNELIRENCESNVLVTSFDGRSFLDIDKEPVVIVEGISDQSDSRDTQDQIYPLVNGLKKKGYKVIPSSNTSYLELIKIAGVKIEPGKNYLLVHGVDDSSIEDIKVIYSQSLGNIELVVIETPWDKSSFMCRWNWRASFPQTAVLLLYQK